MKKSNYCGLSALGVLIFTKLKMIVVPIILTFLAQGCENNESFYRPDLPELLCISGVVDIDTFSTFFSYPWLFPEYSLKDSLFTHSISFEKSIQPEYSGLLNDSLRELSFTLTSSTGVLLNYQSDYPIWNPFKFKLTDKLEFLSDEIYYLQAKEKDCPEISSEIKVPEPPSSPTLISVLKEHVVQSESLDNIWGAIDSLKSVSIKFSFLNNSSQKQYYALILDAIHQVLDWAPERFYGYLDFEVRESNSFGFFAPFPGLYLYNYSGPPDRSYNRKPAPVHAYFFAGKIGEDTCEITISTQFHGLATNYTQHGSVHDWENYHSLRIQLLSIPEELYIFEKSLYTYRRNKKDPFSEPVLLQGNIKGGDGIFAICRSNEIIINLSPPY